MSTIVVLVVVVVLGVLMVLLVVVVVAGPVHHGSLGHRAQLSVVGILGLWRGRAFK